MSEDKDDQFNVPDDVENITLVLVGPTVLNRPESPHPDALMCPCVHCENNTWVPDAYEKTKSKGLDVQVWCLECYKEHSDSEAYGGMKSMKLDIEKITSSKGSDELLKQLVNSNSKEELIEALKKFKAQNDLQNKKSYLKFFQKTEQNYASMAENIPALLASCIATLRPWNNIQDLSIAVAIKIMVDKILIENRNINGEDNVWGDWSESDVKLITMFGSAIVKAQEDSMRCVGSISDENSMDAETQQEVNLAAESRWEEGLEHYSERMNSDEWGMDYENNERIREYNENQRNWENWNDSDWAENDDWSEGEW